MSAGASGISASGSGLTAALGHVAVLETGDERGEFAGLLIASLGAAVTKLEPLNGSPSRRIGAVRIVGTRSRAESVLLALQPGQAERDA